jgi:CheY-like chemotaxis protein
MRSDAVVIASVRFQNPAQMGLAQHNDVVQTLAPDRSDQPFGKARSARGEDGAVGLSRMPMARNRRVTTGRDPIAVSDHITRSTFPRKGLGYLTCNPLRCRVGCDVDPDEVPTIEPHDDEGIEQVEANGRDNKQVHGGNVWRMIAQESAPSLAGRSSPLDHVLGNSRLSDLKPKLEQLAMNTRCSPKGVFCAHPPDQPAKIRLDLWPPSSRTPTSNTNRSESRPDANAPVSGRVIVRACRIDGTGGNLCAVCNLRHGAVVWGMTRLEKPPVILVVEDDEPIQSLVEDALGDGGFEPAIAASGEEAVTLLRGMKSKYRALVTDISLRGKMDGWEVAQKAREIDPEFPVVYMSGASAADWPSKGVPNSVMLPKPFAPAQLVTAVSNLLNNRTPTG